MITALARSKPPDGRARWTTPLLADEAEKIWPVAKLAAKPIAKRYKKLLKTLGEENVAHRSYHR
jgi:hypothetical protein